MRNNRGITLVELMVSIALISIVILFLFALLVDVKNADNRRDFDRENQQNRALILKTIQTDFLERELIGFTDTTNNDSNRLQLTFQYKDSTTGILTVYKDSVVYTNTTGTETWPLKKGNSTTFYNVNCVGYLLSEKDGDFFSMWITIPLVAQRGTKNYIDDLEFFYLSDVKNKVSFPGGLTLGKYNATKCSD